MPICCGHQQNCSKIGPLRAKPLRANKHSVFGYASKGERVQYEWSVHHCLSPFFAGKNELGTFFSPFFKIISQKITVWRACKASSRVQCVFLPFGVRVRPPLVMIHNFLIMDNEKKSALLSA